jgi:plasmid stabilization system protein ParE
MVEEQDYQIVITAAAERAYFEALEYIFEHHSLLRANKIALELLEEPKLLKKFPKMGAIEQLLKHRNEEYRFILFERTQKAKVKIIYYADDALQRIYITDFFPCELFEQRIKTRK